MNTQTFGYLIARLWSHLGRRRRHFALLLCMIVISAFAEIVSLGAVLPFIGILAAPEKVMQSEFISGFARNLGVTSSEQLVLPLAVTFALTALAAGAMRILVSWFSTRLTFATGADLSIEVYRRALYQPYSVHIARGSSEMISGITGKIGHTTLGVILPSLTLISSGVLLLAIMATLMLIDPVVATVATLGFGASYGLITWVSRRRLRLNSKLIAEDHVDVVKALQEGLGGIRDVLLHGTQPVYCEVYRQADLRWRLAQGENIFIAQSPRFAMEAIGMVLIAALAFGLSRQPGGLVSSLPVLAALALGAQRLLPAMQQGYAAWTTIAGSHGSFADTIKLLDQPLPEGLTESVPAPLSFEESVRLDGVWFRYGDEDEWVLNDINLRIPKGARIGFVGSTGSGKSTLLDLLMGLLRPTEGRLLIDGEGVGDDGIRAWQQIIAHVPQSIFLADASLAENIAFGVTPDAIDHDRVRIAARQARIASFIEKGPDGYGAIVGERGVRLSGGQRQRIGIARALYRRANVLILDEATSALDNETEQSVMDAIEGLDRDLTVLIVAHRLSTVKSCDSIIKLDQGRIVARGAYEKIFDSEAGVLHMERVKRRP